MTNPYYDHSTFPAPNSAGSSAAMRTELDLIEQGFAKLPTLTGNESKLVAVNATGTALEALTGNVSLPGNLAYTGTLTGGTGIVNLGSGQLYKDAAGNLGVGTVTPGAKFVVSNAGAAGLEINPTGGVGGGATISTYNRGTSAYTALTNYSSTMTWYASGSTRAMDLDASGNLGIGTASPGQRLDVAGAVRASLNATTGGVPATYISSNPIDAPNNGSKYSFSLAGTIYESAYVSQVREGSNPGVSIAFGTAINIASASATEKMRLDSAGNLGIGTSSPGQKLVLQGSANQAFMLAQDSTATYQAIYGADSVIGGAVLGSLSNHPAIFRTNNTERMRLDASGNLGIGTNSPASKLDVRTSAGGLGIVLAGNASDSNSNSPVLDFRGEPSSGQGCRIAGVNTDTFGRKALAFYTSNTASDTYTPVERMRLDSVGNLGLGVVPSAWGGYNASAVIQTNLFGASGGTGGVSNNAYFDGSAWRYIVSAQSTKFESGAGAYTWATAPSGTAGNAITFTQAMTLDAFGNLTVGPASANATLTAAGIATFKNTVNSSGYDIGLLGGSSDGTAYVYQRANAALIFGTNNTERMRLDSAGNLGLGVTPSAWGGVYKAVQNGQSAFMSRSGGSDCYILSNTYYDGASYRYVVTGARAAQYVQNEGSHVWGVNNVVGTAGAVIGFTQAMTLDASGNLGIGTAAPGVRLEVVGAQANWRKISTDTAPFYSAVIKARGSAGAPTTVALGDSIAAYQFYGYNGTNEQQAATIIGRVDYAGTVSATSMPGALEFFTTPNGSNSPVSRMYLDSAGNLGIGAATPAAKLTVAANAPVAFVVDTRDGTGGVGRSTLRLGRHFGVNTVAEIVAQGKVDPANPDDHSYGDLLFRVNTISGGGLIDAMTIAAGGNLGLGVTPSAWGAAYRALDVRTAAIYDSSAGTASGLTFNAIHNGTNWVYKGTGGIATALRYEQTAGQHQWFTAAGGGAGGATAAFTQTMTLDASGNLAVVGNLRSTASGVDGVFGAGQFVSGVVGVGSISNHPLVFATNLAERARIDSGGDLLVGTTASSGRVTVNGNAGGVNSVVALQTVSGGYGFVSDAVSNGGTYYHAQFKQAATPVGSITSTGSTTAYNTTSDQRLKTNIVDAPDAADLIDSIKVRSFDWISDDSHQRYGMVAQELFQVAPEAVHAPADPDAMMAVDYSKLVPMLIKEIQSLRARVAALEA